jgi:hypothetical protein
MKNPRTLFQRLYHSATLMTWGSFLVKAIQAGVVLPLVLRAFPQAEVGAWLLFLLILSMLSLTDLGFSQSFSRAISYAFGGAERITEFFKGSEQPSNQPNWQLIGELMRVMRRVYAWLGSIAFVLLVVFGTLGVHKSITATSDPTTYWLAWGVVLLTAPFTVYGILFTTYLMGVNQIARMKRWDMAFGLLNVLSAVIILAVHPSVLLIVLNNQFWAFATVLRNRALVQREATRFQLPEGPFNSELFRTVWASSWRSALGILLSYGVLQMTGVIFAQLETSAQAASYLLALRIMNTIVDFSRAPFYSKLPTLSLLRAQGRNNDLVQIAQRGMILTQWVFVGAVLSVGLLHEPILRLVGSQTPFVETRVWAVMCCAFFFERYGSMHLQLYTITNHIIWHKVNAVTAAITLSCIYLGYNTLGLMTFPLAMLVGNGMWYAVITAFYSYREFNLSFFRFEPMPNLIPFVLLSIQIVFTY